MKVCVFPGQGAHRTGMGAELFPLYPELVASAESILGYSIVDLCLENPEKRLDDTRFTQPALFVVTALSYLEHRRTCDEPPRFVAGHSLGEYTALFASGALQFSTALRLVQRRAELMSMFSAGGMAAVIGCSPEVLTEILETHKLSLLDIANYNSPAQLVLAGPVTELERARRVIGEAGYKVVLLTVGGPFHSRYMRVARCRFEYVLERYHAEMAEPTIPVIANVDARPYGSCDTVDRLGAQIDQPVRWGESIRYLLQHGATTFVEVGPGSALSGLIANIRAGAECADTSSDLV